MKHSYTIKFASIFILLFITCFCEAQPFAPVGAKWYYGTNEINGFGRSYITYEITKDTLIDNNTYSVVSFADIDGKNTPNVHFYLRKDSMKVYYWYHNAERTLFDYNVLNGDTVVIDVYSMIIDTETKLVVRDTVLALPFRYVRSTWQKNMLNVNDSIETYILHEARAGIGTIPLVYTNKFINTQYSSNLALLGLGIHSILETSVSFRCYNDSNINFKKTDVPCDHSFVGVNNPLLKENEINIYPNPVVNALHIEQVLIYSVNGRLLIKQNNNEPFTTHSIDVSALPKGIYHAILSTNNGEVYHKRFIKE
jgi:hypothetical protein